MLSFVTGDDVRHVVKELREIRDVGESIANVLGAKRKSYFSKVTAYGVTITGEIKNMDLREGQQAKLDVTLKTKAGNPAAYEKGSGKWQSSDDARASVEVDPTNELSATLKGLSGADNTPVLISFTADGDPDADQVRDIVATLDCVVTQGEAFVAEIAAGAPVDQP